MDSQSSLLAGPPKKSPSLMASLAAGNSAARVTAGFDLVTLARSHAPWVELSNGMLINVDQSIRGGFDSCITSAVSSSSELQCRSISEAQSQATRRCPFFLLRSATLSYLLQCEGFGERWELG